jgi:hypothetical protein
LSCWASEEVSRLSQDVEASPQASTGRDAVEVKETLVNLEKQAWEAWKKHGGKFFQEFFPRSCEGRLQWRRDESKRKPGNKNV